MSSLSETRRDELIDRLTNAIKRLKLETPALWLLEIHKPLSFLGGQALLFFQPLLAPFGDSRTLRDYALLLEDRENVERLLKCLERS